MNQQRESVSYEPMFGGIAATFGAVLLLLLLLAASRPHGSTSGSGYVAAISCGAISWGVRQIVGYRKTKRENIPLQPAILGSALGCVLIGLLMSLVTVVLYEVKPAVGFYMVLTGVTAAVLLLIGVTVGVRQGVWRNA